jgi:hypothetical protein
MGGPVAQWLAARARNALRRPLRIIGVSIAAFLFALMLLILIPRESTRAARLVLGGVEQVPDTLPMMARVSRARSNASEADSALRHARASASDRLLHPPAIEVLGQGPVTHRDSVAAEAAELSQLLSRA